MTTSPVPADGVRVREALRGCSVRLLALADAILIGRGSPSDRKDEALSIGRAVMAAEPSILAIEAERNEAREEGDLVRDDSAQQMRMLDSIAGKLGLALDEGLEDVGPFLVAIERLEARAATLAKRLAEVEASNDLLRTERNALAAFARDLLDGDGDVDGGELQDTAVTHGLLREVAFDPTRHTDVPDDLDPGDLFCEMTGLCAPRASPDRPETGDRTTEAHDGK